MKKTIIAIMVVFSLFTNMIYVTAEDSSYSDTKTSDWFYGSLDILSAEKIITGFPDGTFKPSNTLNIDQYITILCRLTDNDVGVASGYWAQNYIDYANENGWLEGLNITDYTVPINRFQASRLVVKALKYDSSKSPAELAEYKIYISDYNSIPTMYRTDVLLNYALGLTNGYPDGTFQGTNTLTRAEAAVISHRVFDPDVRKLLLDPEKTEQLLAIFAMDNMDEFAPLEPDITMLGAFMMFALPPPPPPPLPALPPPPPPPVPITALPLLPPIADVTEDILADTIIEMADEESDNIVAAGYGDGLLNINLMSQDYESILIYTAADGSNVITLDLMLMVDDEGNIRPDASDLILIICNNISPDNGQAMHDFIMVEFANRATIPEEGSGATFDTVDLLMTALTHDHNVTKVTFTLN